MRHSIRARLVVTFIGLAIGPLLLVGIILAYQSYTVQQQQAVALQKEIATRKASQVTDLVQELENEMEIVVTVQGLRVLPLDQQKSILYGLLRYRTGFDNIYLLDNTGQELVGVARKGLVTADDLGNRSRADEFTTPMA